MFTGAARRSQPPAASAYIGRRRWWWLLCSSLHPGRSGTSCCTPRIPLNPTTHRPFPDLLTPPSSTPLHPPKRLRHSLRTLQSPSPGVRRPYSQPPRSAFQGCFCTALQALFERQRTNGLEAARGGTRIGSCSGSAGSCHANESGRGSS